MARIWPTMSQSKKHADSSEMLLDGWLCCRAFSHSAVTYIRHPQRLQIGGDMERLDIDELADAVLLEPGEV